MPARWREDPDLETDPDNFLVVVSRFLAVPCLAGLAVYPALMVGRKLDGL
jgi:hypothetical protein